MGLTKCESEIYEVAYPVDSLYAIYSDLNNFGRIREGFDNPAIREQMVRNNIDDEKIDEMKEKLKDVTFTSDTIQAPTPMGPISLEVVEREAPKLLKLATVDAPMQFYIWVQFMPSATGGTRLRVTTGADVNMMMKMVVKKPLQQAADGLAKMLAGISPDENIK